MMHMYPYNNLNSFNSFEGESSFVQAQGFPFQQQNWNLYNQFMTDQYIFKNNNNTVNVLAPTDQNFSQHNFQQSLKNTKKKSNNVYSKFTIPSITSIISQPIITNNANIINNFPSLLQTPNNIFPISPSTKIQSVPTRTNSPMEVDFNFNDNINLLNQSSQVQDTIQSSNSLSYFATPDKDTAISLQDIMDGMKVMQGISTELETYRLNNNLLQGVMNDLNTDLNENPIEWLVQENWKEMSKQIDTYEFKETLTEKKLGEKKFRQDVDDLIEQHMKGIKKFAHNEILCQEILTESSNLEYQFKNETSQIVDGTSSSIIQTTTTYNQGSSQEVASSSLNNMFVPQGNNFSLPIGETSTRSVTTEQRTFKCNEIGCSKEYNCYSKLKSHKAIHTNDKPFTCNVFGCNKKFKRSGELIKHQLDHLN